MVTINIDGKTVTAAEGMNLLEAALQNGIYIPHLCHHPDLPELGSCRLCIVEIEGQDGVTPSCMTEVRDGMVVHTKSETIDHLRKLSMELLLAAHPEDCSSCPKYGNCEMQQLIQYMGCSATRMRSRNKGLGVIENPLIIHDMNRCVLCGRCVRACNDLRGVHVLQYKKNEMETYVGTLHGKLLQDSDCRFCGACAEVCPTGSIRDIIKYNAVQKRDVLIPCQAACPAHTDIPAYTRAIAKGDFQTAVGIIREKLPFPGALGHVCNHKCEEDCRHQRLNEPIAIRELKKQAASKDNYAWKEKRKLLPDTGKRVAVIGGGPAGLTAAYYIRKQGHAVTVFERKELAGGAMQFGIPAFRLPKDVVQRDVNNITEIGVKLKCSTDITNPTALLDSYDAVVIATGTSQATVLPIDGHDAQRVYTALDVLAASNRNTPIPVGKHCFVIGGGSVAFDTARLLKMQGAETVTLACLESWDKMLAPADEVAEAQAEGISVHPGKSFLRIASENGMAAGVETQDVKEFVFDENRRLQVITVDGSNTVYPADMVVFAVGQRAEIFDAAAEIETGRANTVVTEQGKHAVKDHPGLFAAGDVATGSKFVITAIAAGRTVAQEVDRYLGGDGDIEESLTTHPIREAQIGAEEGFPQKHRCEQNCQGEAGRCLQCDLRFDIANRRTWSDYASFGQEV